MRQLDIIGERKLPTYTPVPNRLTIRREPAAAYGARTIRVLIDGNDTAKLGNRGTYTAELPTGAHTVELILGGRTIGVQQVNVASSVDVTLHFSVSVNGAAAITVTQISTGPVEDGAWVPTQPASGSAAFEERGRGNNWLLGFVVAIVVLWLLWFVLSNLTITFRLVPTVG